MAYKEVAAVVATREDIARMATLLRVLCADMVEHAGSGHPGMPMGMADVAATLFAKHLTIAPHNPEWVRRDRFILSAGHGSALVYALLHLTGSPEMTLDELKRLRRKDSLTPGHPEFGHTAGIECTTGPLGQGFATAVGMAIAEKMLAQELGKANVGHRLFVMAGDGCLMEGISHEAAALAGHLQLDNLVLLFDDNEISIDGPVGLTTSENIPDRFAAYGWDVMSIDGHDIDGIDRALARAGSSGRPHLIACKTKIGCGAPTKAGTPGIHGSPLGASEIAAMRVALDWTHAPFDLPSDIAEKWRAVGHRGDTLRDQWLAQVATLSASARGRIEAIEGRKRLPPPSTTITAIREAAMDHAEPTATRVSSKAVLERLVADCPWLIGGSADLSGSNGTRVAAHRDFDPGRPDGNYLRYGIREHAMAAAMNGIALSGAYTPYGGTFLVFSDYCRPAIRLAALMKLQVIYVFTHDSIGLGEDGPTHQPVEHLASLRLIPGLRVFRPADAVEVAECWELALTHDGPSVLALSRQELPLLRGHSEANLCAEGAYTVSDCFGKPEVVLFASGSEVALAVAVQKLLAERGISVRVISVPCLELATNRSAGSLRTLVPDDSCLCVSIEAGSTLPWKAALGRGALTFGVDDFGSSTSASELFASFGLTPDDVAASILAERS